MPERILGQRAGNEQGIHFRFSHRTTLTSSLLRARASPPVVLAPSPCVSRYGPPARTVFYFLSPDILVVNGLLKLNMEEMMKRRMYGMSFAEMVNVKLNLPKPNLKPPSPKEAKRFNDEMYAYRERIEREQREGWARIQHLVITI